LRRFFTPFHPADIPPCGCRGGTWRPDPADLLPAAQLYLHMHESTVRPNGSGGVARWENEGPISTHYVRDLLGSHCRFTITGVIDLANQAPVDGYEIPARLREALHLRTPTDVFPYAPNTRRGKQADHTKPYRHKPTDSRSATGTATSPGRDTVTGTGQPAHQDHSADGYPGQTGMHNLGPMTAFHHRVKTHAPGWQHAQPFPGIYLWKAPHGSIFLVDHTGTRQLRGPRTSARYEQATQHQSTQHGSALHGSTRHQTSRHAAPSTSPTERRLAELVLGA
jgi:hypothetical protein